MFVGVGCGVKVAGTRVVGIVVLVIVIVAVDVLLEMDVGLEIIVLVAVDAVLGKILSETDASFSISPLKLTELLGNHSSVLSSGTTICIQSPSSDRPIAV